MNGRHNNSKDFIVLYMVVMHSFSNTVSLFEVDMHNPSPGRIEVVGYLTTIFPSNKIII